MSIEVTFGVKSSNLEEARRFVEHATGLPAEARENSALGGDYYAFGARGSERLNLVNNNDVYDNEPIFEFPDWKLLLLVWLEDHNSPILRALESEPHFEKLATDTV
jgi:hypothetical protein